MDSDLPSKRSGVRVRLSTEELRRLCDVAAGRPIDEMGAKLSAQTRNNLKSSDFALPEERRYPIHDLNHGRAALSMAAKFEKGPTLARIRAAVYRRYPELKKATDVPAG